MRRRGPGWHVVWLLSITSMLADVSGEMLMAVLPFILISQGASGLALGLVGSATEGLGHILKLGGGWLGRKRGHRRNVVVAGYLTASLSRLGIALASTWPLTLGFRALDRVGKGLRTAPRDAILAEVVAPSDRGRAFAIHRAFDTLGAVIGVVAALALLTWAGLAMQSVVLLAAGVGLVSVIPLLLVREPQGRDTPQDGDRSRRSKRFVPFVVVASVASLGHLSYLFPVLEAAGDDVTKGVLWYLLFNLVFLAIAFPAGALLDRFGATAILGAGFGVLAAAMAAFAADAGTVGLAAGFVLMGVGYAFTEGNLRAHAARLAGHGDRSFLLGIFHTASGLAIVVGGIIAGLLWDRVGHGATFAFAAVASGVAALGMAFIGGRPDRPAVPRADEGESASTS